MKQHSIPLLSIFFLLFSCNKLNEPPQNPIIERKVRFELYTTKDFSDSNDSITFSVFIKKDKLVVWDSVLTPIRVKEIPKATNKIIILKKVPDNDASLLKVGFNYTIKNIGYSSYFDAFYPESNLKVLNYNF